MNITARLVQTLQDENQDLHDADRVNTALILKMSKEIEGLKKVLSQYEQPVSDINVIDGVRNHLIDEAE